MLHVGFPGGVSGVGGGRGSREGATANGAGSGSPEETGGACENARNRQESVATFSWRASRRRCRGGEGLNSTDKSLERSWI